MRRCDFCRRWFKNLPAMYAHLRHCEAYHAELDDPRYCHNCNHEAPLRVVTREYHRHCPVCDGRKWARLPSPMNDLDVE